MTAAHRPAPNSGIGITCHAGSRGAPPSTHASRRRATVKNRTCSYVYESGAECGRRHLARGYCELHYQRWLRGSSMEAAIEAHVHHTGCRYCRRKHHALGLCAAHYQRSQRGGKNMDAPIRGRMRCAGKRHDR